MPKKETMPYPSGSITIEKKVSRGNYQFAIKNDTEVLNRLRQLITKFLKRKHWEEQATNLIELAVDEAVMNAMAHGNLEINTKGKKTAEIEREISVKNQLEDHKAKRVYISFTINQERAEIQISDNGSGLDPKIITRLNDQVLSYSTGQRGFSLIRRICSNIIFGKDPSGRYFVTLVFEKSHLAKKNTERVEQPALITMSENYIES